MSVPETVPTKKDGQGATNDLLSRGVAYVQDDAIWLYHRLRRR